MIQSNEIRVGNVFDREIRPSRGMEYERNFILTEEMVGILFSDNNLSLALNDLFPIPLTPTILEQCGIEDGKDLAGTEENTYFLWGDEGDDVGKLFLVCDFIRVSRNPILYVHQLQNLYYSLTCEELQIKL